MKDGYTAIKFDLDQAADPNKYDQFNWTAGPAEIQRMVDQLTAARQAVVPKSTSAPTCTPDTTIRPDSR